MVNGLEELTVEILRSLHNLDIPHLMAGGIAVNCWLPPDSGC